MFKVVALDQQVLGIVAKYPAGMRAGAVRVHDLVAADANVAVGPHPVGGALHFEFSEIERASLQQEVTAASGQRNGRRQGHRCVSCVVRIRAVVVERQVDKRRMVDAGIGIEIAGGRGLDQRLRTRAAVTRHHRGIVGTLPVGDSWQALVDPGVALFQQHPVAVTGAQVSGGPGEGLIRMSLIADHAGAVITCRTADVNFQAIRPGLVEDGPAVNVLTYAHEQTRF